MKPTQAASLSVLSNSVLVLLKLISGLLMGSVSVISEAIHSGLDLLAAIIALFSVSQSGKPPDERHAYGHGKIENISALVEALLIFVAAIWIIFEAARKLARGVEVESLGLGIVIMGFSAVANYTISTILFKVGKKHDSQALEADGLHLRTDVYTSVGVFAGLGAIYITGVKILDPIIAIGVAVLIIKASWDLTRRSFMPLLDVRMSEDDEDVVREAVESFRNEYVEFHKLRTRKAGPDRHIDLHLVVHPDHPISEAHDLADRIERAIRAKWPRVSVLIHMEPCESTVCEGCTNPCEAAKESVPGVALSTEGGPGGPVG